jgi:hypothetical protein
MLLFVGFVSNLLNSKVCFCAYQVDRFDLIHGSVAVRALMLISNSVSLCSWHCYLYVFFFFFFFVLYAVGILYGTCASKASNIIICLYFQDFRSRMQY